MSETEWGQPITSELLEQIRVASGVHERRLGELLVLSRSSDGIFSRREPIGPGSIVEKVRRQSASALLSLGTPIDEAERPAEWVRMGRSNYVAGGESYRDAFWSQFEVHVGGWALVGLTSHEVGAFAGLTSHEVGAFEQFEQADLHDWVRRIGSWGISASDDCDFFEIVFSSRWLGRVYSRA